MANKTQKRKAQRHKEDVKAQQEKMKNLSQTEIYQLENYAVFQILYVNDAAYNCCKFLAEDLKTIPYKTNAVQKVYGALMKRWKAYLDFIEITHIDLNSVAALFSEMDEYMDDKIVSLQKSIQEVLDREHVQYATWVAKCETATTVCNYASHIACEIIAKLEKISKRINWLKCLIIEEPKNVMSSMSDVVNQIHVKSHIDLNKEKTVEAAFRQLNKAFCDANNFKKAQIIADEENVSEGRMTIM